MKQIITFIIETMCDFMANDKTNGTEIQIAVIKLIKGENYEYFRFEESSEEGWLKCLPKI